MAISLPHYTLLRELYNRDQLPQGGKLLEIGEANVYDQDTYDAFMRDVDACQDAARKEHVLAMAQRLLSAPTPQVTWYIVKLIYEFFLRPASTVAIDLDGTPEARTHDLNTSFIGGLSDEYREMSAVYNHGTAEHIFNIANVFRLMHECCKVGGLMIHEVPFTGWVDHGFYTLQPTLFYDVAAANHYEIVMLAIEQIDPLFVKEITQREHVHALASMHKLPANAMLFVAMRKQTPDEFRIPMQGVYARNVSSEVQKAWRELR